MATCIRPIKKEIQDIAEEVFLQGEAPKENSHPDLPGTEEAGTRVELKARSSLLMILPLHLKLVLR